MLHARTCLALMTLTLAVTPLIPFGASRALADGRGGAGGGAGGGGTSLYAFGLPHTAMGGATLSLDTAGRLIVSNIGSSGNDGVSVELGRTAGYAVSCDFGTAGQMATATHGKWKTFRGGGIQLAETQLTFAESNGGQCDVLLDYTGTAATCVEVVLRNGGVVVASSMMILPPNSAPALMCSGSIGSHDGGAGLPPEPPVLESEASSSNVRLAFRPAASVSATWAVALPGGAPVACDDVSITLHGLPPGEQLFTRCDLTASGLPGGVQAVSGGEIKIKHKGWDGLIYGNHRAAAVGGAHITGVAAADICAGCYECCHPENGDALSISSGVLMDNLGSSGQDGVAFHSTSGPSSAMELQMGPPDFSNAAAALELRATATFSDMSSRDVSCTVSSGPTPGSLSIAGDFSSLASVEAIVDVFNGNTVIGSVVVSNPAAGTPLAMVVDLDGLGMQLVRCSTIPGDALAGQSGYGLYYGDEELVMVSGQGFVGDGVRVRANDSTLSVVDVEELVCYGRHIRQGILTCRSVPSSTTPTPASVVHDGLVHTTLGAATMVMRDSDGDGAVDLQLHNIGSSGQDGVSIDLSQSQGGAHSFCGNGVPASNFTQMRFEAIDDECPTCPAGVVASVEVVSTGPSSVALAAGTPGCCRGHVIIMKRGGSALAGLGTGPLYTFAFPLVDDEPWPISGDPGSTLRLRSHHWLWRQLPGPLAGGVGTGEDELQIRIGLAQESGGGGGAGGTLSGVTVSHPLHGTFTNVEEIVISRCIDSDAGLIDETRMLFTAAPGCVDCTVAIEQSSLALHGHQHHAMGQARLVSEDCDDADPVFSPTLWVANIGSSGQDGVEIKLPAHKRDRDCDETDPLPDVIGAIVEYRPAQDQMMHKPRHMIKGSLTGDDDATDPLSGVELTTTAPNRRVCTCPPGEYITGSVRGTVRDQFGNVVLDLTGLPPSAVCEIEGADEPQIYTGAFTVTPTSLLAGAGVPPHVIEACTHTLTWPSDVIFLFGGQAPVTGRSLELHATPPVGTTVTGDLRVNAVEISAATSAGTTGAMGIIGESVTRMPRTPPCPADIAPWATNGDNAVNVTDLLAVISGWGTCASCPATPCAADVTHDCAVNVTDLLAVISAWGACP